QTAGRGRGFLIDVERRDGAPALRLRHGGGIAREPQAPGGLVVRRERTARLGPAHHADDVDDAVRFAVGTSLCILTALRTKPRLTTTRLPPESRAGENTQ